MAYNSRDISVLAYANGFTLWHYRSADTCADIRAPRYFDNPDDMLRAHDLIIFTGSDGDGFTFYTPAE